MIRALLCTFLDLAGDAAELISLGLLLACIFCICAALMPDPTPATHAHQHVIYAEAE